MSYLPCVEVENNPGAPVTASVIWLHGLGADGHDFAPLVPELHLPESLSIRFIFPHAPQIPVTVNGGYIMPAWYDILEMSLDRKVDELQLTASAQAVHELIKRELERGVANERIILAGFSQGGAVVYQAGYTFDQSLGGLLVLSSYFATSNGIVINEANKNTPILIQHGTHDPIVAPVLGERAFQFVKNFNANVNYETYAMEHTLCSEQVMSISRWLQERLIK
ncbi:MAG: carboxylesterase [Cellvibrio sp. 79]|nr:MAG: carboxylesterase [Cellvibrio sp. 79]